MFYYSEDFVKEIMTPFMTDENSAELVEKMQSNRVEADVDVQAKIDAAVAESNRGWNARVKQMFLEGGVPTQPRENTGNANTAVADMAGNVASAAVSAVDSIKNLFKTVPVDEYNKK